MSTQASSAAGQPRDEADKSIRFAAPARSNGNASRFAELHSGFDRQAAIPEANRCLFCFDAPCTTACPTHIDVPRFIRKIASTNFSGAAATILDANILGGSCARACPVEVLCEGACVLHHYNKQPIQIGRLQRFAIDTFHQSGAALPFSAGEETGRSVALIGAGPASLACAAELRRRGIRAVLFDARALPGGLNTFGVAEYKLPVIKSLREIEMLAQLGVEFHFESPIDAESLTTLESQHDAIFLGMGLGSIHRLGVDGENLPGVMDALELIRAYKSGEIVSAPERVVVIGAGNTAIDAAIASVRLGAKDVRIAYRRGPEQMSAFSFEYEHARREGVQFDWYVQPLAIRGDTNVNAVDFTRLEVTEDESLVKQKGSEFARAADWIILAIGQAPHTNFLDAVNIEMQRGRIVIDHVTGQTSCANYFAGGDCTNGGREVVDAVADGKRAAIGIAAWLGTQNG